MNIHFQDLIPPDFDDNSRVWVYQSNRPFSLQETLQLEELLESFSGQWKSHGHPVKGFAKVFFDHFIILMADETNVKASGCSTDTSLRLIKNIEQDYNITLLNRQMMAFIIDERVQLIPLAKVNSSIEEEFITPDTLYFNNTILTKKELMSNWIIPVKQSWLSSRIPTSHL